MKRLALIPGLLAVTLCGPVWGDSSDSEGSAVTEQATQVAQGYLTEHFGGDFKLRGVFLDQLGEAHVRFDQLYQGIPVFEGQVIIHLNAASGTVRGVTDARRQVQPLDIKPRVDSYYAHKVARGLAGVGAEGQASSKLVVFIADDGTSHLAWRVNVLLDSPPLEPADWVAVMDAHTGKVLLSHDNLHTKGPVSEVLPVGISVTGTANTLYVGTVPLATEVYSDGTYGMHDPTRGGNYTTDMLDVRVGYGELFVDVDNIWGDFTNQDRATAGADAHFGATMTWDYYLQVHGRQGVYDNNEGLLSRVHFGHDYANAFWSDACRCMTYGDGDGVIMSPLVSLDIAAHEMTHGVTSATAALTYFSESGGLNESMSDIFGSAVEFYAAAFSSKQPNYWLGEDVWTPATPGDAFRYMDHPTLDGHSIDHYSQFVPGMDVHYSSGIANNVFYLLSEGGTNDTSGIGVTGIGRDKAERIFYRALSVYMTPGTDFAMAKEATVDAATDLYGTETANLVALAWEACGVF